MTQPNKRKPRLEHARRYDWYGRPVTSIVTASPRPSHSQVFSRFSTRYRLVNRFDDLDMLKAVRKSGPNTVRFAVRNGTVTRMP